MRVTGYALLALSALLCVYVGAAHLVFQADPVEQAGPVNAPAVAGPGSYWLALIPAAATAAVGLYMVFTKSKGFATTYDLGNQQAPRHA